MDILAAGITVSPNSALTALVGPSTAPPPSSSSPDDGNPARRPASYFLHVSVFRAASARMRDEACVAFMVLLTFWIFACLTVILGLYGSSDLELGPNSSYLVRANPFFVQSIQAKELQESKDSKQKAVLYGFSELPPLDVEVKWSETHVAFVESGNLKEWQYFLNEGSRVRISYSVKRLNSDALSLVIAEGRSGLFNWMDDPSYANKILFWDIIDGNGVVEQEIVRPENYYIALRNLNFEEVEVQMNFTIEALMYNGTQATYKCSLSQQLCTFTLFQKSNIAVITSPGPEPGTANHIWRIKLYYGHRWISYFVGSASVTVLILFAMKVCFTFQITEEYETRYQTGNTASVRAPLISQKDDDLSSWSSYESLPNDEDELNEPSSLDGKQIAQGVSPEDKRRLCVLCSDALRDSFFLPCGHWATCLPCGTRVIEEGGKCPVCHRVMKKVRKIFSV